MKNLLFCLTSLMMMQTRSYGENIPFRCQIRHWIDPLGTGTPAYDETLASKPHDAASQIIMEKRIILGEAWDFTARNSDTETCGFRYVSGPQDDFRKFVPSITPDGFSSRFVGRNHLIEITCGR